MYKLCIWCKHFNICMGLIDCQKSHWPDIDYDISDQEEALRKNILVAETCKDFDHV